MTTGSGSGASVVSTTAGVGSGSGRLSAFAAEMAKNAPTATATVAPAPMPTDFRSRRMYHTVPRPGDIGVAVTRSPHHSLGGPVSIQPVTWYDYDPDTGQGNPATPLEAVRLNQMQAYIRQEADRATDAADTAEAVVSDAADTLAVSLAPVTVSAAQSTLDKIAQGAQDVAVLMLGDSIDIGIGQWFGQLGAWLGGQWPSHTFTYEHWDDATQGWTTYPLTTGTGPRTVRMYNGAVGGKGTSYPVGTRLNLLVGATQPDLVLIGYLANEADDTPARARHFRDRYAAVTEAILTVAPQAAIIACGKPGKPATPGAIENRTAALRELVRAKGFGFIDFYGAFVAADPNWASTLIDPDGVHPTTAGQTVMFTEATRHFTYTQGVQGTTQTVSSLTEPVRNLLTNGDFSDWTGAFPAGWLDLYTPSPRATASKDTTWYETGAHGMKVVPTNPAAPEATIYQAVSTRRLKGQWVTLAARVRVNPAQANRAAVGRTTLYVDGASAEARISTGYVDAGDGFHWVVNSIRIPTDAGTLQCWLGAGDATGAIGASEVTWDRAILAVGMLPRDMVA